MNEYERITHPFQPIFDEYSKILILGSLPSVKSREHGFYYGHPQNRFWKVLAKVYAQKIPISISEKKELLHSCGIAIWDVIESCEIKGSGDSSIRNAKVADFNRILQKCSIEKIFANGKTAGKLYNKFAKPVTGLEIIELPSTSPANAAYSLDKLVEIWSVVRK